MAACRLSLVAVSRGYSSLQWADFSLWWLFLLWTIGSRHMGSAVASHGLSCPVACGIFPDQGWNLCPLHHRLDSYPLDHQGSPLRNIFIKQLPYASYYPRHLGYISEQNGQKPLSLWITHSIFAGGWHYRQVIWVCHDLWQKHWGLWDRGTAQGSFMGNESLSLSLGQLFLLPTCIAASPFSGCIHGPAGRVGACDARSDSVVSVLANCSPTPTPIYVVVGKSLSTSLSLRFLHCKMESCDDDFV